MLFVMTNIFFKSSKPVCVMCIIYYFIIIFFYFIVRYFVTILLFYVKISSKSFITHIRKLKFEHRLYTSYFRTFEREYEKSQNNGV